MPAKLNAAFYSWFGDSVVRNEDGSPMVVYHTGTVGAVFDISRCEFGCHFGVKSQLSSFKHGENVTRPYYLSIQHPLRIPDLFVFDSLSVSYYMMHTGIITKEYIGRIFRGEIGDEAFTAKVLRDKMQSAGYDGIVYLNRHEGVTASCPELSDDLSDDKFKGLCPEARDSWIILDARQAKHAVDNDGTWDADDPNIGSNPQRHTSSGTSIKQIAGVFKAWQRDGGGFQGINLDIGGGKYDAVQAWMSKNGINCVNLVWDKFNRSAEHNDAVLEAVADHGGADSVTIANVLNVIDDKKARRDVLLMAEQYAKIGAPVLILIYEGNKSGIGATPPKRPDDWQNNLKAEAYEHEIASVFGEVLRSGKIFLARAGDRHTRRFARRAGR